MSEFHSLESGGRYGKLVTLADRIREHLARVDPGEHVLLVVAPGNRAAAREYLSQEMTPEDAARVDVYENPEHHPRLFGAWRTEQRA